jgi:hypothetical protein
MPIVTHLQSKVSAALKHKHVHTCLVTLVTKRIPFSVIALSLPLSLLLTCNQECSRTAEYKSDKKVCIIFRLPTYRSLLLTCSRECSRTVEYKLIKSMHHYQLAWLNGGNTDEKYLGCTATQSGRCLQMFRRNVL